MKKNSLRVSLLVLIMAFLVSCSAGSKAARDASGGVAADYQTTVTNTEVAPAQGKEVNEADRKLVKTGNISLSVDSVEDAQPKIAEIAKQFEGYVFSSNLNERSGSRYLYMEIKVAAKNFDNAMAALSKLGVVRNTGMNVSDVTRQYTDLSARLETLKIKEKTLQDLLSKAKEIADILEIENNLQITRESIEATQGELNYIKNTTDYSQISVNATDKKGLNLTNPESPTERFLSAIKSGLMFWKSLTLSFIELILFTLPVLIPLAVISFFLGKFLKKKKKDKVIKKDRIADTEKKNETAEK